MDRRTEPVTVYPTFFFFKKIELKSLKIFNKLIIYGVDINMGDQFFYQ